MSDEALLDQGFWEAGEWKPENRAIREYSYTINAACPL